ncbi:MAG: hypothetical protein ABIR52_05720 [Casimicrobiaceae bacterium]
MSFNVALKALHDAMTVVRGGMRSTQLPNAASKELLDRVSGSATFEEWTRRFLGGG